MELIEQKGGLGNIKMADKELELAEELFKLSKKHCSTTGRISHNTAEGEKFQSIISDIFPCASLLGDNRYGEGSFYANYCTKNSFSGIFFQETVRIDIRLYLQEEYNREDDAALVLNVLSNGFSPKNELWMSILTGRNYTPNCIDDIASLFGKRENPPISEVLPVYSPKSKVYYGIADVPRMKLAFDIYQRARTIINNVEESIGLTKRQLGMLRRDSLEHENVAIRDLSKKRYDEELANLLSK